jgi:two-component system copper resistance phosphate regulon response regulator CusR
VRPLVVDDDPKFREFVRQGLGMHGIDAQVAGNAAEAEAALDAVARESDRSFDLILLDVMMPGPSGWEFLEAFRQRSAGIPVIFVTARHEVEDRVRGLRLGADDYIIKPFEFAELLARIEVAVRRRGAPMISVGDLRIDLERHLVERDGARIEVSPREFDLLQLMARSPGKVFSREELLREVWGIEFDPGTNVVNVQIARLRRKLASRGAELIHTVKGRGYLLAEFETG